MNEEFYIGYNHESPPGLAASTRWVALAILLLVLIVCGGVALLQTPASPGTFEFGKQRMFEGVLEPGPVLRSKSDAGIPISHLLVGSGKHAPPASLTALRGMRVRFNGTLIQKGAVSMIEVNDPESIRSLGPAGPPQTNAADTAPADVSMVGELVDTKCYLGVMRPGTGKVHRACAVRCLSGGVPPGLRIRTSTGDEQVILLTGPGGEPLRFDFEWAAREVRAVGKLTVRDGLARLEVRELSLVR